MERDFAREHSFNPHRGLPESLRCELRRVLLGDCEEEAPAMTFRQIVMRAHGGWVPASEARHFHNHQRFEFVCRTMHALLRRGDCPTRAQSRAYRIAASYMQNCSVWEELSALRLGYYG